MMISIFVIKGSTYPDANGGIGILFEQGSSRFKYIQNSQEWSLAWRKDKSIGLIWLPFNKKSI